MPSIKTIRYAYEDVPTVEDFAQDNSFVRGLMGPFGSGKSSGCVVELINRALAQAPGPDGVRHTRWAVVRNSYPELQKTTIKTLFQWLPPAHFGRYVENKHTYTVKAFEQTDMEILFLALDRPDDIKMLLSLELTGAWVNEAREVPWSIIEALQGRVGRYPPIRDGGPTWHGLWADTNPPDSDSKWYKFFEETKHPPGFAKLFKQPSGRASNAENLRNLPGGQRYYTNLAVGKSAEWIKVYVDGEYGFVVEGKLVYPEYSDAIHCKKVDPIEGVPIIRSYDFGLTPACAFSQLLPDGRWLTFDEMTSDNMSIDQFTDEVLEHCARAFRGANVRFEDWGDPAGEQRAQTDKRTCFEIMQNKGVDIQGSIQNPALRQESVRKTLRTLVGGEPQFILHPRCRQLRKGFMGGYHRRRMQVVGPERYSEHAEKNSYSHCFPAGVMVSTPLGDRPIEALRLGDMVHTPLGQRAVVATMDRQAKGIITLHTNQGRTLPCTLDHPIWTDGGFVRADALRYGDILSGVSKWADAKSTRSRNSTASGTIESHPAITAPTRATTCTGTSGAFITAPFPLATMSTTRTKIAATTGSKTWRRFLGQSMRRCTASSGPSPILKAPAPTWPKSARWRAFGMDLLKAANGIASTARLLRPLSRFSSSPVSAAAPTIRPSAARPNVAIAPQHASLLRAERAASTMKHASASNAARISRSIATRKPSHVDVLVLARFDAAIETRVYDLTIEDAHCFYANGILVSNCHEALQYGVVQYFGQALIDSGAADDDFGPQVDYAANETRNEDTGY